MNETIKGWLLDLYADARADAKATIQNERIWANGAPDAETAAMHESNISLQEEYVEVLTALMNNLTANK